MVRIAGLPLDTVQCFASGLCTGIGARASLASRHDQARAELVERLHGAVPGAPPELRRFLLAVKRDCHNARPIRRRAEDPRWQALRERTGPAADRALRLEVELAELNARFQADIAAELDRQRRRLLDPLDRPDFLRGLALASPDLYDATRALRGTAPADYGRRERKAEASLLRYVTRAATKVSPYSTFTPVALGELRDDPGPGCVQLDGEPWEARSLVRIKRYLLHRVIHLLCSYPPFRERQRVELNDSLSETSPGRFLYLRPHHWRLDPEEGVLRYQRDALATVSLRGPLIARVTELTAAGRPTWGELVAALAREFPDSGPERVREHLDGLLHLGVLQLRMSWPIHEGHLEKRMLAYLRTLPGEPGLERLVERLQALVSLEDGYAEASDPARSVRAIERAIDEVGDAAAPLGGLGPPSVRSSRAGLSRIYEDVFLQPSGGDRQAARAGIASMSRAAAEESLRCAELLVRLSALFDHRKDFLHTLAAVGRDRWPDREGVGVLQLLQEVQPLWRDYMKPHLAHWRENDGRITTWNPLELPELEALHRWRSHVAAGLAGCARVEDDEQRVCPDTLRALLDEAPREFSDPSEWGAMLMLQPASTDGSLWMLNRLREGTGRYVSRYTPVMDEATREWYTAHLADRSSVELEGERVELLDVHCVHGDTINVHAPQTGSMLTMPDDEADLPPHRRVRLRDLLVAFDPAGGLPRLRDRGGQRYLAVNLGIAFEAYLPTLAKFLCLFGPSELGTVLPPVAQRRHGPLTVTCRTVLGNLVVHRRSWTVPADLLRGLLQGRGEADAFVAMNHFRAQWGLPERGFFWDMLPHDFFRKTYKPQYLDFTSPLFLPLLRGVVEDGEALRLAELLPTPEMYPRDGEGRRRAVEVLLDTIALRRPRTRAPVPGTRAQSGREAAAPYVGGLFPTEPSAAQS